MLFIEGYTDQLSVQPGDEIGFHVSTNTSKYSMEIARVGAQREVVWTKDDLSGVQHPVPKNASSHGCGWPAALKLLLPKGWKSGYYSVILRGTHRDGSTANGEMAFVVRSANPGRDAHILLQRTTNTDNAYNTWGGSSLYRGSGGPARRVSFDRPYRGFEGVLGLFLFRLGGDFEEAFHVGTLSARLREEIQKQVEKHGVSGISFSQRATIRLVTPGEEWEISDPFGIGPAIYLVRKEENQWNFYDGMSRWGSGWLHWEHPFVVWAERAGYAIDYAVNSDLEFRPEILHHYRLVLSVGHDEYWSFPMRDHLEAFIASGGNVVFFSGNTAYWQVRSQDNGRALACWKDAYREDPLYKSGNHKQLTTLWCSRLIQRPENQLTGVSFAYGGYHLYFDQFRDGAGGYTVHRPEHWVFEGTGLRTGDRIGTQDKIVSYECDGCEFQMQAGLPVPTCRDGTPETFQILASAPAGLTSFDGSLEMVSRAVYGEDSHRLLSQPGACVLGTYTAGGTVVTTGCTNWVCGLQGGDQAVERITRNILDRLST